MNKNKVKSLLFGILLLCSNFLFAQHLKKDGTPDRRYKENKITYSSSNITPSTYTAPSTTYNTVHLKKDGTPDKRYKENKSTSTSTPIPKYSSSQYSDGLERDSYGRIKRSEAAKLAFMKQTGYTHGRPGYVIDHIIPLKKHGCDCPSNMQWQTIADAKAKDKWE